MIVDVSWRLGSRVVKERDPLAMGLMIAAFILSYAFHVNVIYLILGAALLGVGKALWTGKRRAA